MQKKVRFKLYKGGKHWLCAAVFSFAIATGAAGMTVHADINYQTAHTSTVQVSQQSANTDASVTAATANTNTQQSSSQTTMLPATRPQPGQATAAINVQATNQPVSHAQDTDNHAWLDNLSTTNNTVHVSGWHATNQAAGRNYHYVIAYDQTLNHEIARQQVTNSQQRDDVAKAYPNVDNAQQSGFNVQFNLTPQFVNDQIAYISRWTDDSAGNGHYVDYWFNAVDKSNHGWLDSWDVSDGGLKVIGWHASDASVYESNHYLIVYDQTAHRQVASAHVDLQNSPDVARAYPNTRTAGHARFSFDFASLQLMAGHTYSLVSRYSTTAAGNGNDGIHTDYWYPAFTLNRQAAWVDAVSANGSSLTVRGWMAADASLNQSHPYVIFLDDNGEIGRQQVTLTYRADVARAYPHIYNSAHSGFSATFTLPPRQAGHFRFVLRFSSANNGEGQRTDYWSKTYAANVGWFDRLQVNNNSINIAGWHAAAGTATRPYQYIIITDAQSGREYGRWQVNQIGQSHIVRNDVQNLYPWLANSGQSGFTVTINNLSRFDHRNIRVIHRYTDDPVGNGNYIDYVSAPLPVHSWYQIGRATYHMNNAGVIDYVLNDAEVISQRPELPTGCEITAVTMMLRYAGANVNKIQLANEMPRSNNPYQGFMGSPFSNYGYGLWVAPSGVASVVRRYLGTVVNMTGWSLQALKDKLINRHLVVAWQGHMHGFGTHAITLTGFDSGGFFYNDPWTGRKNAHMTFDTFDYQWRTDPASRGALSY